MSLLQTAPFESLIAAARAQIIATEFLFEQLVAMNAANAAFDVGFGGEPPSTLTHGFEKSIRL